LPLFLIPALPLPLLLGAAPGSRLHIARITITDLLLLLPFTGTVAAVPQGVMSIPICRLLPITLLALITTLKSDTLLLLPLPSSLSCRAPASVIIPCLLKL
jgi:hypothetical protein